MRLRPPRRGDRSLRPARSLLVRVPLTAVVVFVLSMAVAVVIAYRLLLSAGLADVDVVLEREQERFGQAVQNLLDDAGADSDGDGIGPTLDAAELEDAGRRYLELNPANESYWTIIRLDGRQPLASLSGPSTLEPLFPDGLPIGALNRRETLESEVGPIRSATAPITVAGEPIGSYQIIAPLEPIYDDALRAAGLVAAAAAIALTLGSVILTLRLRRALSPLGALSATARATELTSLDARVAEPAIADEVGRLAEEFNSMLGRLERASRSQTAFLASVSHELRTPITVARGHLELLRSVDRDDPRAVAETIVVVEDELRRMSRLVEDLLAIARADVEGFVRPRELELVAFFEELELKVAGLRIDGVRIDPPPPTTLHADPDRLAQAVLNLVANAGAHTPDDTRIRVGAEVADDEVILAVDDDGPGIDPTIRDDVFAPFVRAGEVATSTGLGLAVVRAVVDAHHGSIAVDTGEDGTRIALHLPLDPVAVDTVELLPAPPGPAAR